MPASTPGGAKLMQDKRIALVTGANQGVGFQVAKELVANGLTVLAGSRNFERGEAAAEEIGPGAIALQLDVTDRVSIAHAAERIRTEFRLLGRRCRRWLRFARGRLVAVSVDAREHHLYSHRNATVGSTRAARHAGISAA